MQLESNLFLFSMRVCFLLEGHGVHTDSQRINLPFKDYCKRWNCSEIFPTKFSRPNEKPRWTYRCALCSRQFIDGTNNILWMFAPKYVKTIILALMYLHVRVPLESFLKSYHVHIINACRLVNTNINYISTYTLLIQYNQCNMVNVYQ